MNEGEGGNERAIRERRASPGLASARTARTSLPETDGSMSDQGTSQQPAWIPPKPPVRPQAARLPAQPPAAMVAPGYRARGMAKLNAIHSAAAPRVSSAVSSAKQSAVGRLQEFRDRQAEKDLWGGSEQGIQTTSRQGSVRSRDFADPAGAAGSSASRGAEPVQPPTPEARSRWGGWFSSSTSSGSSRRDTGTYGDEKIVCFPGVSRGCLSPRSAMADLRPPSSGRLCNLPHTLPLSQPLSSRLLLMVTRTDCAPSSKLRGRSASSTLSPNHSPRCRKSLLTSSLPAWTSECSRPSRSTFPRKRRC